jgi:hypothetical protein
MITPEYTKPLGQKAYGHIPHLPGSRMGPSDHHCHEGQSRICTEKARDRHDTIIVQEKLDGSCVAVARIDGILHALGRSGWPAISSNYEQHRLFAQWVLVNQDRFMSVLTDGERLVGEWLAQAHSTRYNLRHEPFVPFDLITGSVRATVDNMAERLTGHGFTTPQIISYGPPVSIPIVLDRLNTSGHGAVDRVEGAVWRVERKGVVDFLAKYVRPDKEDGIYLPEVSGSDAIWNWRPDW